MVQQLSEKCDFTKIVPDFIYNRIDFFSKDFVILRIQNEKHDCQLEVQLFDNHAELGAWMMTVFKQDFDEIASFLFHNYCNIEYISFYNVISDKVFIAANHYHLILPNSYEELKTRISAKSRNTMSRKRKKAEADFGKIEMVEYENDCISDDIISIYFDMKEKTHHIKYGLSNKDYLIKFHVSNVYVLYFGNKVAAIIITCEQCPIAYLENLTYDMDLSKYSPGMMAYEMVLERLILKGKTAFYLSGGDYDYKKKYGSVETAVTEGKIYRSWIIELKYRWIDFYNKRLYWKIQYWKRKLSA
jgi:hypothetical protein